MLLAGSLLPLAHLAGPPASTAPTAPPSQTAPAGTLDSAFARAAATYEVPRDLLVTLGYAETHLDGHGGAPSASGGYGVMHLVSSPASRTLERAATLTRQPVAALKADDAANIVGGAAVLRAYADELGLDATARKDPGKWYQAVAKYGNASTPEVSRLYADTVYELLAKGYKPSPPAARL
ncbi:hypothetical protein ACFQX6_16450 [Streptosporangium lutulentum]